jgi:hypothetical protein
MSFLANIIIGEAYSSLDNSTKPTSDNFVVWNWSKVLSTWRSL